VIANLAFSARVSPVSVTLPLLVDMVSRRCSRRVSWAEAARVIAGWRWSSWALAIDLRPGEGGDTVGAPRRLFHDAGAS
jgi:hypothetical protein